MDESAFIALLGAGCGDTSFEGTYARHLWQLASRIQSAINRLSDSEMEFKAARQAIADVADIAENFSATPPQSDATGFWLTNVFYECGPTGQPINPQYYSFHVEAAGSLTVLGLTPGFGGSMSYWVRIEGVGYYTYSGRMYCDADTVAGYQWLVQPGPPNFQLLTLGDAIQRAQVRYVQALNDLEGVLEDTGKILPQLLEEANGALSFTTFLNTALENPNIGAAIFATTKLGKIMSYYGKSTAGRYATNLALMGYGSWLTLEKLGRGLENLQWSDYTPAVVDDWWLALPGYGTWKYGSAYVIGVVEMSDAYATSVDDIVLGTFEGDDARVVGGLINHGPASAETLLFLATLPSGGPKPKGPAVSGRPTTGTLPSKGITDYMPSSSNLGRKVASPETLARVEMYLNKHGIDLIKDAPLRPGQGGKFFTNVTGERPQLWIPPNASEYQLLHELIHARQFIKLGRVQYAALGRLSREQHVFESLMKSRRLSAAERANAQKVMNDYREELGGGCPK